MSSFLLLWQAYYFLPVNVAMMSGTTAAILWPWGIKTKKKNILTMVKQKNFKDIFELLLQNCNL